MKKETYCLACRKYTKNINPKIVRNRQIRLMTQSNCAVCNKNYKKVYYKMSYYPPYKSSSNNIKVELDLTNYATKTDLNNITHVDTSSFASKTNLAALKTEVDKINIGKLKTAPTDLAKLTNAAENDLAKKNCL